MVAAVAPDVLEVNFDRVGELVGAGLRLWVQDAARQVGAPSSVPARERQRCADAWDLILRRPHGSVLVGLAAQLGDVDEWQVWESLERGVVELAGG